jgi:phage gp36-like protein
MAYATTADATTLYGSDYVITSCDRDNTGTLDTASFEMWLDVASDKIDGYFFGRYALPLANVPRILIKYCVDIAIHDASADAGPTSTNKKARYDEAIAYLEKVAKGEIRLIREGTASAGANEPNSAILVTADTQILELDCGSREFTREKLRNL